MQEQAITAGGVDIILRSKKLSFKNIQAYLISSLPILRYLRGKITDSKTNVRRGVGHEERKHDS
jgi:hypothetical protein